MLVKLDKNVDFIYPKKLGINLMLDEFYISVVPEGILLVPRVKNPIKVLEEGKSYRKT